MIGTHLHIEFDFYDDRPEANTGDFKDELEEKYQQAYLEGRMTNVVVQIDHAKNLGHVFGEAEKEDEDDA